MDPHHHAGCTHTAPSLLALVQAEAVLDHLIGSTFGLRHVVQKADNDPLDRDQHASSIRAVLRRILAAITPAEQQAESRLLRALRMGDWGRMSEAQRDRTIAEAMGAITGLGVVLPPKIGPVLRTAGRDHITQTKAAVKDRYSLEIEPTFQGVDQRVLDHMVSSQALYIRNEYGQRATQYAATARRIAARGVELGLSKVDIGEAMVKAFRGTSAERSESYFRMAASVFMGRARSYATVSGLAEAQIEYSEWSASLSEECCDACRFLDGQTFPVAEQVRSFLDVAASEDPEAVRFKQPFVSRSRDDDGEYLYFRNRDGSRSEVARVLESAVGQKDTKGSYRSSLTGKQLAAKGIHSPPLHGHCFCLLVPAELDSMEPAPAAPAAPVAAKPPRPADAPVEAPPKPRAPEPAVVTPAAPAPPPAAPKPARKPRGPAKPERIPVEYVQGSFTEHAAAHGIRSVRVNDRDMAATFRRKVPTLETLEKTWSSTAAGHVIKLHTVGLNWDGHVAFKGHILNANGDKIGDIERSFKRHADGRLEVHHDFFKIDVVAEQGKKTGETMLRQAIQTYRKIGASEITVDAAWVGRYTWATFGFDWADEQRADRRVSLGLYLVEHGVEMERAKRIAREAVLHTWDVAALDVDKIRITVQSEGKELECKVGKAFLLSKGMWSGTLSLNPRDVTYKRAKERLKL